MAPSVEGSCPETNVISLEHRPTGRCFKTNPQRTRPLSGANFLAASEVCFDGGPPTGRSSSPSHRQAENPPRVGEGGRSSRSWHLCMCKTSPPRTRRRMWNRGEGCGRAEGPPRLVLPSRLRLSVINLIEALFLVDCGSKRSGGAAKKRNETERCLAPCACVRLANPCPPGPPSRVLKPYPLTLLVGADDRLSGSAARNSWPRLVLGCFWCSVAIFVVWVYIRRGCVGGRENCAPPPSLPSLGLPFREIMA